MNAARVAALGAHGRRVAPGLMASAVVGAAAAFLAGHYNAPVMLFALLLGMSMSFLSTQEAARPGIEFAARDILRIGVALLGLRITIADIASLGWGPIALVIAAIAATIGVAMLAARALRFNVLFGFLTGGATAICGASAALALSAALPAHPGKERATTFTIIGVSALSTLAMVVYPMLAQAFGFSSREAGVFFGATIHDVAQVVGAGYSFSPEAGDVATVVKLMRVALLLPVILCAAMITRSQNSSDGARPPLAPWFAVAFAALAALNSTGWIEPQIQQFGVEASRACLVVAIAALGMKTQLRELAGVGARPIVLMIAETVFLAGLALALLQFCV